MFLRQSTVQTVLFGPCLDAGDGVTEETALTLAQADMRLSKDGGAFAQKNATGNATHDSDGWYSTSLNVTDTNTVGKLILNVHQPANMLPVRETFYVLEEVIFDLFYDAASDGQVTVAAMGPGVIDAASIAANAITDAKIASAAFVAAKFGADFITNLSLSPAACNQIAAHTHRITLANVEADTSADTITNGVASAFCSLIANCAKYQVEGSFVVYYNDAGTAVGKRAITTNANTQIITLGELIAS